MHACLFLRRRLVHSSADPIRSSSSVSRAHAFHPPSRSPTPIRRTPPARPSSTFPLLSSVRDPKRAGSPFWTFAISLFLIGGGTWIHNRYSATDLSVLEDSQLAQQQEPFLGVIDLLGMMPVEAPPGTVDNLTREQGAKLQEFWVLALKVFGVNIDEIKNKDPEQKDKSTTAGIGSLDINDGDDKHGQSKEFQQALVDMSPEEIRRTVWNMVKHDNPDALFLRFLRARKWDVKKAFIMFISTIRWRSQDIKVDDDIMKNGDLLALKQSQSSDPAEKKKGEEFLAQLRWGKSFLHGVDKAGRPICVVRVRLHKAADQSEEALERYTVYLIESTRMMLAPPVETAVGFVTIANRLSIGN